MIDVYGKLLIKEKFFVVVVIRINCLIVEIIMNSLDPIAKNVLPSQNRSYQIPMNDQQFENLLRTIVHVSFIVFNREKKLITVPSVFFN
jgi:hypothetical protein